MKVAIAGPTGHVGSKLASGLLDAGAEAVLLCRDPAKVTALTARGAKVDAGDLENGDYVLRATRGVDALFWLSPPNFTTPNLHGFQEGLARNAAEAIRKNAISRVVNLSSIGAQMPSGTGPVAGLHQVEHVLNETGASVTHLRAGYFMENHLFALHSIREAGSVFLPVGADVSVPMVATQDVAAVALACLLNASSEGQQVRGIHGPADLSFGAAASTVGQAIGRPVRHVEVTPEDARKAFLGMGTSPDVAAKYVEMYQAFGDGRLKVAEPRRPETTTPTTLLQFAVASIKPLLT
ncbi:MAG TPA: NAD(P)H-binding protein [Candidatus Eisenbacteria bacterium]|nr:NAD(P)H-binding protein [Candidatus Eisenbacteria bacterium]